MEVSSPTISHHREGGIHVHVRNMTIRGTCFRSLPTITIYSYMASSLWLMRRTDPPKQKLRAPLLIALLAVYYEIVIQTAQTCALTLTKVLLLSRPLPVALGLGLDDLALWRHQQGSPTRASPSASGGRGRALGLWVWWSES